MTEFKPVPLSAADHAEGLCHYRALIEGVQCAMRGALPDGTPVRVSASAAVLLSLYGSQWVRVLVVLYRMRTPFGLHLLHQLGPEPNDLVPALEGALRGYYAALTEWLAAHPEGSVDVSVRESVEHDHEILAGALPQLFEPAKAERHPERRQWDVEHQTSSSRLN